MVLLYWSDLKISLHYLFIHSSYTFPLVNRVDFVRTQPVHSWYTGQVSIGTLSWVGSDRFDGEVGRRLVSECYPGLLAVGWISVHFLIFTNKKI